MVSDQFSGTTEATWSEALGVGAPLTGMTRGTFKAVFKVEEGLFADGLDGNWSGLVLAGVFQHTEYKDQSDQGNNGHDGISVSTVKVEHL